MDKKQLEAKVKKMSKTIAIGDAIILTHNGKEIARYNCIDKSIDTKTPLDWLRGCFVFEIGMKGIDIKEIDVELVKN